MSNTVLFKGRLQEYTQKSFLPSPVYETTKEGPEHNPKFKASVFVNGTRYDSTSTYPNLKAAEHAAAQVALEDLLKKSDGEKFLFSLVPETGLCKNLLQVYAQRMSLPAPVYRSTRSGQIHSPVFISIVEVAGVSYSGGVASTKKEAEIKAARKALMDLQPHACDSVSQAATQNSSVSEAANLNMYGSQVPISNTCSQSGEGSQRKRDRHMGVTSEEPKAVKPKQNTSIMISTPKDETLIHETGLCKNLLQVYAQKLSLPVPVYRSTISGQIHSPIFISTVEVSGVSFSGGAASTKKEADIKAAKKALMALQPRACDFVPQAASQNISGLQDRNPYLSGSQVPISNIFSQSVEDSQRKRDRDTEATSKEHKAVKPKRNTSINNSTFKDETLLHEQRLCKNLLQEYVQKMNLALPVYTSTRSGEIHSPIFISTVDVSGVSYTGGVASNKKEAETKAAQKALMALQPQGGSVPRASTQNISGLQAPDPNISDSQTLSQNISGSQVSISNICSQLEEASAIRKDMDVEVSIQEYKDVKPKLNTSDAGG